MPFKFVLIVAMIFSYCLLNPEKISGQDTDSIPQFMTRFHIEGNLGAGWPVDNFNRKFDDLAFTLGGGISYKLFQDKFVYLQLATQWYSLDRVETEYIQVIDDFTVDVRHTSTSAVLDFGTGVKYEGPQFFYIIPFAKLMVGARNCYLYSSITDQYDDEGISTYRQDSDWSFLYSISGGLQVPVTQMIHIWLSGSYSSSGSMNIPLPVEDFSNVNSIYPEDYFEIRKSAMTLFDLRLGLIIYLN